MKKIMEYLQPLYGRMAAGFGIKLVGTVMDLAIPWILAHMIDEIVPTKDQRRILLWGVGMAVCAVIALLGNVIANRRASAVARDATRRIRHDLFDKIEHLSARQLDELGIPSLISRLTSDTYNVNQTIGRIQRLGVRAPDPSHRRCDRHYAFRYPVEYGTNCHIAASGVGGVADL